MLSFTKKTMNVLKLKAFLMPVMKANIFMWTIMRRKNGFLQALQSLNKAESKFSDYRIFTCPISKGKDKNFFADILEMAKQESNQSHHKGSQYRPSHLHIVHRTLLFIYESWNVKPTSSCKRTYSCSHIISLGTCTAKSRVCFLISRKHCHA